MTTNSDHFDGRRFFNPTGPELQPFTAVPRMLLMRRARWPSYVPVVPRQLPARDTASAVVTFIGHATFVIQAAAGSILTNPVYSEHAGPWNRLDLVVSGRPRSRSTRYSHARRYSVRRDYLADFHHGLLARFACGVRPRRNEREG